MIASSPGLNGQPLRHAEPLRARRRQAGIISRLRALAGRLRGLRPGAEASHVWREVSELTHRLAPALRALDDEWPLPRSEP